MKKYTFLLIFFLCSQLMAQSRVLTFLTWSDYIDSDLIKKFEKKYDAKINMIFFNSDEERSKVLFSSIGRGIDVFLSSGLRAQNYLGLGILAPLKNKVPNFKHIDPKWKTFQKEIQGYVSPYFWGTVGIIYWKDKVGELKSWKDLYSPEDQLKGKILMINDSRDSIPMALKSLGLSLNDTSSDSLKLAREVLIKQQPFVKEYRYIEITKTSDLVSGKIWMAMGHNGDALTLNEYNPNIAYTVPTEGTNLWIDYLAVPKSSKNKDLAFKFFNFLQDPKNASKNTSTQNFATLNLEAMKYIDKKVLENSIIFPSEESNKAI